MYSKTVFSVLQGHLHATLSFYQTGFTQHCHSNLVHTVCSFFRYIFTKTICG